MSAVLTAMRAAVYAALTGLAEPFAGPALAWLARGEGEDARGERLGRAIREPVDTWWHAASLGEIAALEPVLTRAQGRELSGRFRVTTTSVPGREAARRRWPGRASLAPLDLPRLAAAVFDRGRPGALILVETELWPNWLRAARTRGIRVGVVNGRISDRSWPRYRHGSPIPRGDLARVAAVAARTGVDAERFIALGASPEAVRVTGNTKHDRTPAAEAARHPWPAARLWTVGSLRPGEDRPVLAAFESLRIRHPDLRLVLVPRHADTWPELLPELRRRGFRVAIRSRPVPDDAAADVLLVDTRGELSAFYAASTVALVGGSLVPVGGHNVMEAAAAGAAIVVGPHHEVVRDEVRALESAGALFVVRDEASLGERIETWLADPDSLGKSRRRALETAAAARGSADRTLDWLVERGVLPAGAQHA